jgi:hypothetical protein
MAWSVDERFAPILLFDMQGDPSDEALERYITQVGTVMSRALETNKQYVAIVLSEHMPNASERARIAKAHERITVEQARVTVASFVLMKNPLLRGILTAMRWVMAEKLATVRPVKSYEDAFDEALAELKLRGIAPPNDLAGLRAAISAGAKAAAS